MLLAVSALALTVLIELVFERLHGAAPELALFFGRLHPLIVHLPIGMFVLVGLAEAATLFERYRARIDPVLGLVLPVLVLAAFGAFVLGQLLAAAGGYPARLLAWHRRLELVAVLTTGLALIVWTYQAEVRTRSGRAAFRALLGLSLAVLSIGAHFGGSLTHGDTYLTQYAPRPIKALLGIAPEPSLPGSAAPTPAVPVAEPLLFADAIQPILRRNCGSCHGPEKAKGKLRLDSLAAALKGGENGPALVAGAAAQSLLVKRLRLPLSEDKHMPPEGKPAPTAEEIALVEFWIDRGASPTARVRDALPPSPARTALEKSFSAQPGSSTQSAASDAPAPSGAASDAPVASEAPATRAAPATRETSSAPATAEAATAGAATSPASAAPGRPRSARAILAEKCQGCHGPAKQESKLRVDSLAALLQGGFGGPVLVPGNPNKSELILRVRLPLDDDDHMPPRKKPQLDAQEIAALEAWVQHGAGAPTVLPSASAVAANAPNASPSSSPSADSAVASEPPAPGASGGPGASNASAAPASSTAAPTPGSRGEPPSAAPEAAPRHGGCAACAIGNSEDRRASLAGLGLGLLLSLALWQRRRARSRSAR